MESLMDWKEALFVLGPCIKARCFLGLFVFGQFIVLLSSFYLFPLYMFTFLKKRRAAIRENGLGKEVGGRTGLI